MQMIEGAGVWTGSPAAEADWSDHRFDELTQDVPTHTAAISLLHTVSYYVCT